MQGGDAVIRGNRVECRACEHLLARNLKEAEPAERIKNGATKHVLEVKCKRRKRGVTCDTLNNIVL